MQQLKDMAGSQSVHHFNELENTRKMQLHSFLRGVGSVAVLMPSSIPLIRRNRVGSLTETGNRVSNTWSRAFVSAKK